MEPEGGKRGKPPKIASPYDCPGRNTLCVPYGRPGTGGCRQSGQSGLGRLHEGRSLRWSLV